MLPQLFHLSNNDDNNSNNDDNDSNNDDDDDDDGTRLIPSRYSSYFMKIVFPTISSTNLFPSISHV